MAHHQTVFPYSKAHAMPEPMNASSHHPKLRLSITPGDTLFVAGTHVTGKLEMECRAEGDKGLGIGIVMIELFAIQELASRDHLATNTFLHSRRLFQGPGLPPSNAVLPHLLPPSEDLPPLPQHYFPARRGRSTFFFRIPLPGTCPSSISFAQGQAKVRYELRASAGVFWKNERRLVVCRKLVEVVERFAVEEAMVVDMQGGAMSLKLPEAVVVGENGKIWIQGKILGGLVVAGGSACVELQVMNHSTKKNTSLTLLLTRTLYLQVSSTNNSQSPPPVQISDTLVTVPFRGPEYIISPGTDGVANLVFDVPKDARGVRGGTLDGEELGGETAEGTLRITESLFEIRCKVEVKLGMGMGSKDIRLEIPVDITHSKALPDELDSISSTPYVDQNQIWIPPPATTPYPHAMSPPIVSQPTGLGLTFGVGIPYMHTGTNYFSLPISSPPPRAQPATLLTHHNIGSPQQPLYAPVQPPPRPLSAGPIASASELPQSMVPGFPAPEVSPIGLLPFPTLGGTMPETAHTIDLTHRYDSPPPAQPHPQQHSPSAIGLAAMGYEAEEGKGERALRVSRHLKLSSRHRSVSPTSHRYPLSQPTIQGEERVANYHGVGVPEHTRTRTLPVPPSAMPQGSPGTLTSPLLAEVPAQDGSLQPTAAVLHSPRPQLTPKHSLTNITDAYNQTTRLTTRSERVEELEKMADAVVRRSGNDLSGDVPKGVVEKVEEEQRERDRAKEASVAAEKDVSLQRNKTLPDPPLLMNGTLMVHETEPLPSDQTPPTPTLHAFAMRSRARDKEKEKRELLQELRTENGLDALEQRLLREVGTRKTNAPLRPDVRGVLRDCSPLEPVKESGLGAVSREGGDVRKSDRGGVSVPIPIPMKSSEPLNNDSAISSLTLAGRMMLEVMDDDQDSDEGKTHRAWSRSPVGREHERTRSGGTIDVAVDDDWGDLRMHRHTRERAEVIAIGGILSKTPEKDEKNHAQTSSTKEKPAVQRKKDTKAKAKGRVAAWLGAIDVGAPPQEQIIPPSPSVVRGPDEISGLLDMEDDEKRDKDVEAEQETKGGTAAPNPRSSGFVPIGSTVNTTTALNRNTVHFNLGLGPSSKPLVILRDATVLEEAKRVQALWDGGDEMNSLGYAPAQGKTRDEATKTPRQFEVSPAAAVDTGALNKFPLSFPPLARAQSIRTDRRVSPPSNTAVKEKRVGQQKKELATQALKTNQTTTPAPMSYSTAAKNAWKAVDHNSASASGVAPSPIKMTKAPLTASNIKSTTNAGRLPPFPPPPNSKLSLDPEVRYDVRSARGGRGGKVTAVANLWASGALMNQGASNASSSSKATAPIAKVKALSGLENVDKEKGREVASQVIEERQRRNADAVIHRKISKPLFKPTPDTDAKPGPAFVVPTKTEKKLFSAALMSPAPPPPPKPSLGASSSLALGGAPNAKKPASVPNLSSVATGPFKRAADAQKRPESRNVFPKPNPPTSWATPNFSTKRPATAMPMTRPGSGSQSPQLSQGGRTTPIPVPRTSLSTPSSPGQSKPDRGASPISIAGSAPKAAAAGGGLKAKPGMIMPPSTNPASAVLSSSHAVPHLSSTASLARPHASRNVPTTALTRVEPSNQATTSPPIPPPPGLFPTMLTTSKSAPSLQAKANEGLLSPPPRVGSPSKPSDLSFGQARLRDLIKKYQGQVA